MNTSPNISIITSTYNPDPRVFGRCLNAIGNLERAELNVEFVIVDNNCDPPLAERTYVSEFLRGHSWARLIKESTPGASFGRMRGIQASTGPLLIFFDDDNEPDPAYLLEAMDYSRRFPTVGAFGPGEIKVIFIDPVDDWIENYRGVFLEGSRETEKHSRDLETYHKYYPVGTGLVLLRNAANDYAERVSSGDLKTSCRKGRSLSSGGDIQMVLNALLMGYEAGSSPSMKLNHLIDGRKSNREYIRRLAYGTAASALQCRLELFPDEREFFQTQMLSSTKAALVLAKIIADHIFKGDIDVRVAEQIGSIHGYRDVFGKQRPVLTSWLATKLRLE